MRNGESGPAAVTLLDACSVLTLYATQRMAEVLTALPGSVAVVDLVEQEALYIRQVVEGELVSQPVDLGPLVATGMLSVVATQAEAELETFVDLAVDLDDGEALTAALAIHRGWVLVTDDAKAERLLAGRVRLRSTLDLIKVWADAEQVPDDDLHRMVRGIYERGYAPPRRHPLKPWWDRCFAARPADPLLP